MDTYKIEKANKIYSKMQGVMWAKEKNAEYEHYGACENCKKAMAKLSKDLEELKLTEEERTMVGYDHVDYALAYEYESLYR